MAAYDIHKQFKGLRADTGRRRGRDPFATGFEDDSEEEKQRRNKSKQKTQAPPDIKPLAPPKTSISSPFAAIDAFQDSDDDDLLAPAQDSRRRPSPAPGQPPRSQLTDGAGRRGSIDRTLQPQKSPRDAVALAAGSLAYLDDSDDEEALTRPPAPQRYHSPAPRKKSDPEIAVERSHTPKGSREPLRESSTNPTQPSRHTVASPFAGTKYLQDSESDSDEEAVVSRQGSADSTEEAVSASPPRPHLEVQRVDKPKSHGSEVSWRAFSTGRAEQRAAELTALQTSLEQRGWSISFADFAATDDGARVPTAITPPKITATARGRP